MHNGSDNDNLEQYQLEIGDTERSVEEIIRDLKSNSELVARVKLARKAPGRTAAGSLLTVAVPQSVDAESLKHKLNANGGCMYQIAAVSKQS